MPNFCKRVMEAPFNIFNAEVKVYRNYVFDFLKKGKGAKQSFASILAKLPLTSKR